ILIKNGVVIDCGRAIGIEPKYGDGQGTKGYRDITFENIDIERYGEEGWLKAIAERAKVGTPPLKGVMLKDINIRYKGSSGTLLGFDENNLMEDITFDNIRLYGNTIGATNFAQMNVLNTGFYKNIVFAQAPGKSSTLHIEAEYLNKWSGYLTMKDNTGTGADAEYPDGQYINGITDGNYLLYNDVDFGSNTNKLILRSNIVRNNTVVEIRIDDRINGTLIGSQTFQKDDTGVWDNHEIDLSAASGTHDLYIIFKHSTAGTLNLLNLNFIELKNREFYDLETLSPSKSPVNVNVDASVSLEVSYTPSNAYQREVKWSIVNQSEDGVIELSKDGTVRGLKGGTADVKATSTFDSSISAIFKINVVDLYVKDLLRIEAESADAIYDTYHYDNPIAKTTINDPEDASGFGLINCWNTNFAVYKNVDFALNTIKATIRKGYPRGSKMEFWIDRTINEQAKTATGGTLIGSIEFPSATTDWSRWQTFEAEISGVSGVHDLCLVFLAGGGSATNQNYGSLNWIDFTRVTEILTSIDNGKSAATTLYPNPVTDQLNIVSASVVKGIQVFDTKGQLIYMQNNLNPVSTASWNAGIYLVKLMTDAGTSIHKIVKK
ncbi:MAG: carbohydrate-binding protein, partial [Dysgonomonas sp.]